MGDPNVCKCTRDFWDRPERELPSTTITLQKWVLSLTVETLLRQCKQVHTFLSCTGNTPLPIWSTTLLLLLPEMITIQGLVTDTHFCSFLANQKGTSSRELHLLRCAGSSLQLMLMKPNCQKHNMQQLVYESWDPIQFMGKPELVVSLWFSELAFFVFRIFCFALFPGKHQKLLQSCRSTKTIWKH